MVRVPVALAAGGDKHWHPGWQGYRPAPANDDDASLCDDQCQCHATPIAIGPLDERPCSPSSGCSVRLC